MSSVRKEKKATPLKTQEEKETSSSQVCVCGDGKVTGTRERNAGS
jgi:hypothetical protein